VVIIVAGGRGTGVSVGLEVSVEAASVEAASVEAASVEADSVEAEAVEADGDGADVVALDEVVLDVVKISVVISESQADSVLQVAAADISASVAVFPVSKVRVSCM